MLDLQQMVSSARIVGIQRVELRNNFRIFQSPYPRAAAVEKAQSTPIAALGETSASSGRCSRFDDFSCSKYRACQKTDKKTDNEFGSQVCRQKRTNDRGQTESRKKPSK